MGFMLGPLELLIIAAVLFGLPLVITVFVLLVVKRNTNNRPRK